jgi:hypothetical protein
VLGLACVAAPAPAVEPAQPESPQPVAQLVAPAPAPIEPVATETTRATEPAQPSATIPGTPPYPPNTDWCEQINREGAQPPGPVIPGPDTNPAVPKVLGPITFVLGRPAPDQRERSYYLLWERSIDTPDPSWSALRKTKWARSDRRPGCTRVYICVVADGSVSSVETILPFRNDPGVDAIVRETVAAWRFEPIEDPRPMCWDRAFRIEVPEPD